MEKYTHCVLQYSSCLWHQIHDQPLLLPKWPLSCRAYATTALAHLFISVFSLSESRSFKDDPGSMEISMNEKQWSKRLRFTLLSLRHSGWPWLRARGYLIDILVGFLLQWLLLGTVLWIYRLTGESLQGKTIPTRNQITFWLWHCFPGSVAGLWIPFRVWRSLFWITDHNGWS